MRSHRLRPVLIIAIAAVALGIASTATLAAFGPFAGSRSCAAPALSGTVVDVTLTDMGGMMGNGPYGPGANNNGYPWPRRGMMRVFVNPSTVPAAQVSLRVRNKGALTHGVVVLPLPQGQFPGQRVSGPDGKVDESGSLGEASRTCGADDGMDIAPYGIAAGASGWTTITLSPGRYELICNIAGHYWAGMYTELDVTGQPR
jgi:uncharacterized cupredoxin-like copper-binding protein